MRRGDRPRAQTPRVGSVGRGGPSRGPRGGRAAGQGRAPRAYSVSTLAVGAAIFVVLFVVVVAVVALIGGKKSALRPPSVTAAQPRVLAAIAAVTPAEAARVGLPGSVTAPSVVTVQFPLAPPSLTSGGKPEALAILAEFCPYCGAERWALIMTFQRFGTFANLHETTSSPWDVYPSTATFTFYKSSYSSRYVDFVPVENYGNDTTAIGTHSILEPLTTQENDLWSKYEGQFGEGEGFLFLDIDNTFFVYTPSYSPGLLHGLDQSAIASDLSNPSSPVARAIIGTANYLTAAVCSVDGARPSVWCSSSAIRAAARAMHVD